MKKLYTIKDLKAEINLNPVVFRNSTEAIREFETICKDPQTQMGKYPKDFVIIEIASWDDENGVIEPKDPMVLASGADFLDNID